MPEVRKNLTSSLLLNKFSFKQVHEASNFILSKVGVFVGKGYTGGDMFKFNVITPSKSNKVNNSAYMLAHSISSLWHDHLGHMNYKRLKEMSRLELPPNMNENIESTFIKNRPLERIFRNSISRVIDFLIINQQFNFTTAEISRSSEIPLRTVQRIIPHLVQNKIVIENKSKDKIKNYELNQESKLVEILKLYSIETVNTFIEEATDSNRTRALISNSKLV